MFRLTIAFLLLLISNISISQILNVNKSSIDADSSNFLVGSVDGKFNINNQSATLDREVVFKGLDTKADLLYIADRHAYILINKLNYHSSTGGAFISTGYSHFRINFNRRNKLSYENFYQAQYDDGRNMPFRWLAGVGMRIRLLSTLNSSVYFGTGIMREDEKWNDKTMTDATIRKEIWKTTNYLRANIIFNEAVNLSLVAYYQGGRDKESDLFRSRINSDVHLNVGITGKLSFITSFSMQYDYRPIIPIKKYNYSLTNGLKYDF